MDQPKLKGPGLWENKDKNGNIYLSGKLGPFKILVFKNTFKQPGGSAPDYYVTLAQVELKEKAPATVAEEEDLPF